MERDKNQLLDDNKHFEVTYQQNLSYYHDLQLMILAGEQVLSHKKEELNLLQSNLASAEDYLAVQKLKDLQSLLQQFEKRLHDLKLTKTMTLQTLPQIRLLQHNNSELVNKIQSSILNIIPIWKNQIVLSLGLQKQKRAVEIQQKIHETTNELLIKNSSLLKENTLNVAQLSEQGILDSGTLKNLNQDLISTISGALQIYHEGHEKRQQVEKELTEMEGQLKASLAQVQVLPK